MMVGCSQFTGEDREGGEGEEGEEGGENNFVFLFDIGIIYFGTQSFLLMF